MIRNRLISEVLGIGKHSFPMATMKNEEGRLNREGEDTFLCLAASSFLIISIYLYVSLVV